jgi:hypothetical protein
MGKLLAISLVWTLITTLIFLPALLARWSRSRSKGAFSGGTGRISFDSSVD